MSPPVNGDTQMTKEIFSLECVGIECWDVYTKAGRFVGLIVTKPDGTLRHRYNSTGSKGSARKFNSIDEVFKNIDRRRERIRAKAA